MPGSTCAGAIPKERDRLAPFLEDAVSDAYIGAKILGHAALLAEDRDKALQGGRIGLIR